MRYDCSTGEDHFPLKFIKQVATDPESHLTHIIDTCIETLPVLLLRKIEGISPIPKTERPTVENNYLPLFSVENIREISAKATGNIL